MSIYETKIPTYKPVMHIHLYLRNFPPYGDRFNDGLSKAVHGLASGLVECGSEVTVLSEASPSENTSFQSTAGYTIQCFANPIQHRPSFKISPYLKEYIRNNIKPNDLTVLNGILHPTIYSISRLFKNYGIPYVVAPHDVYHPSMFSKNLHLKWPYWYLLEKKVLEQAKAIQVLDISQTKWLKRLGIKTQIFETPNGFSPIDVLSESELRWRTDQSPKILFFGRLEAHHKGLDILLNAFNQIANVLNTELIFQGPDGGDKNNLEKQASEIFYSKKVSFLEPEYNKPPSLVIANYDIFCLPSRFEGFGLSALEAMLAARVLLVSEEAGIARYVRESDCGVVVKPEVSAIKAGLIELCERRCEWKEMGLRGRQYVLKYLRWNKIASSTLEQYKQLFR